MEQRFKSLIIGAGNVGAFYDRPNSQQILTHAHAFSGNEFNLVGFVDTDFHKALKASGVWGGKAFPKIIDAFNKNNIDVVCVAVPDEEHYSVLKEIAKYNFRLAFVEKPFTTSIEQAKEIISIYLNRKIEISVNYTRRFLPEFELLRKRIVENYFGNYIAGIGFYGKGLLHNGSHMVDLLRYFFGNINGSFSYDCIYDFTNSDPSISAILRLQKGGSFLLHHINRNLYTIFDIDLLFEKGRIKIDGTKFSIEEYEVKKNTIFPSHQNLMKFSEKKTSQNKAMHFAAKNISDFLTLGEQLKSTARDATAALDICFKIKNQLNEKKINTLFS